MADLKINGNTYNGITELNIPLADGSGNALFSEGSGGGEVVNGTLLFTATEEMLLTDVIAANPIPRAHETSLVWIKVVGENVATEGSQTVNWVAVYCNGKNKNDSFIFYNYVNGLHSPDSLGIFGTVSSQNSSNVGIGTNGEINKITLVYLDPRVAVGNSVYYIEIPFSFEDFKINPLS